MSSEVVKILEEQNVGKENAKALLEAFGAPFEDAGYILKDYKNVVVKSEDDFEAMSEARDKRLALKKIRTSVENKRKELKEDSLRTGRAIDSVAKFIKENIEPAEAYLQTQEDYAEIKIAERKARVKAERIEQLAPFVNDVTMYNIDDMSEDQFLALLKELKTAHEARIAEEKRIEEERIAQQKADEDARKAQAEENERLKAEAVKREEEQAKKDAEAKTERDRIQREADEKLAEERAERVKLEQAESARLAEEARKKAEAEEQAKVELLAPDKDKLKSFANALNVIVDTKLPAVSNDKAQRVVNHIKYELQKLSDDIVSMANHL